MRLWYIWHNTCTYLALKLTLFPNGPKRASIWALSPRVPSGASKTISQPVVRMAKPCTYHAPKVTLSPKGPKGVSTWPTSPMIRCVHHDFRGYDTFGANCWSILHRDLHYLQMDRNEILHDPRHLGDPSGHPKWFPSLRYVRCKPCTYHESRLALYPIVPKRASNWASSPRSAIRCVQNDLWGYGTFGANRAPIFHWN
jgi:hypothetical protein